ncbi:hypothetical protein C8R43DRAFT_940481 [Mycena crocata]|nr:hypothetical protein C8R43DRAFT_940481 [Mycena crocata]
MQATWEDLSVAPETALYRPYIRPQKLNSFCLFKHTEDNVESQMATDHIGLFLLRKLLAPKFLASKTTHYTPVCVSIGPQWLFQRSPYPQYEEFFVPSWSITLVTFACAFLNRKSEWMKGELVNETKYLLVGFCDTLCH